MEILGVFHNVEQAAAAIDDLIRAGISENDITSLTSVPYPDGVLVATAGSGRRLYRLSLGGGLFGAACGFSLAAGTAWLYPLQTGDKPIISIFPAGIITFEFAMLFAIAGALLGMLLEMRLPAVTKRLYDPGIADGLIGVAVTLKQQQTTQDIAGVLRRAGAERVHIDDEAAP